MRSTSEFNTNYFTRLALQPQKGRSQTRNPQNQGAAASIYYLRANMQKRLNIETQTSRGPSLQLTAQERRDSSLPPHADISRILLVLKSSEDFQKCQQKIKMAFQSLALKKDDIGTEDAWVGTNLLGRKGRCLIFVIKKAHLDSTAVQLLSVIWKFYIKIQMASKSSKVLLLALVLILAFDLAGAQTASLPSYVPNPNCQTFNGAGDCTLCATNFYLQYGYCFSGNPLCVTSSPNSAACLSCIASDQFSNGYCLRVSATCASGTYPACSSCDPGYTVISTPPATTGPCVLAKSLSPFCDTFSGSSCTNCVSGYYVFSGGCAQANPICLTYNMTNGQCLTCYPGNIAQNGNCVDAKSLNPFCSTFNGLICSTCQAGYFPINGICTLVNPLCATYNSNGGCLSCSTGTLVGNLCLIYSACTDLALNGNCLSCPAGKTPWGTQCVTQASLYPFCSAFGTGNNCTACVSGAFLANGVCLARNPFCKTSDAAGRCLSCYTGATLSSSLCIILSNCATQTAGNQCATCPVGSFLTNGLCALLSSLNPTCASFSGNSCQGCLNGYYLNSGICFLANPACLTYNQNTGACTTCYNGLSVLGNVCGSTGGLNPFCSTFNGAACSLCSTGYALYNGVCYLANPNCATYGPGGICLSCAQGDLVGYLCLVSTSCDTYDLNDPNFLTCLTCPTGYTLWNSQCISYASLYPFCQTFDSNYVCTLCSPGSYFSNGVCVIGNPFCATYNSDGSCNTCTPGNQLAGPLCLVISPGCATTNSNGVCATCPAGYTLLSGTCVSIVSLNPYCSALSGSFCSSCLIGYYIYNGQCYLASSQCFSYNMNNGGCTACYNGFIVYNGACVSINLGLVNPNCQTFNGLTCTACNSGFYFYQGICIAANQYCATFDPYTGYCQTCAQGTQIGNYCYISIDCLTIDTNGYCTTCPTNYVVWSNICVSFSSLYPYCSAFDGLTCTACYSGYYISNGICVVGNPFCATSNINTGQCLSCLFGYTLYSGLCLQNSLCGTIDTYGNCLTCPVGYTLWTFNLCISIQSLNPYCLTFTGDACSVCSQGFYLSQGFCVALNSICATYEQATGACLTCPYGYVLYGFYCFNVLSTNQYCATYTGVTCTACQAGYYFNNGICTLANAFCATFNANGYCLTCITGFTLNGFLCTANVACLTSAPNGACLTCPSGYLVFSGLCASIQSSNPFCITFNAAICTVCQSGYYIAINGICSAVSSNCLTYNMNSGACLSCPSGYVLFGNYCFSYILQNPFCSTFSGISCTNCAQGYYFNSGICIKGNPFCATLNVNNGNCLTCVAGYTLSGTTCIISAACTVPLQNGQCPTCPAGFTNFNGLCINQQSANPYCLTFAGPQCLVCQDKYFLDNQGICIKLISNCLTYDQSSGDCISCPAGYTKIGTICWNVISINPFCSNFVGLICTACNQGYYFQNGICVIGNPTCATFDPNTGYCLTCIAGYYRSGNLCFINGVCLTSSPTNVLNCLTCQVGFTLVNNRCVDIRAVNPYCKTFVSGTNTCSACFNGYYIGTNGICTGLNSVCDTYNMNNGGCTSCPSGFILYGKICVSVIIINPNCAAFSGITCNYCKNGYYLNNGICVVANAQCATYQMTTGNCLSCYSGYTLNGIYCIATVPCTITANNLCTGCPAGYIVWNGLCVQIGNTNPYCLTFTPAASSTCTACFNGYYLGPNGICVGINSICNTYDMATGSCLTCPQGFVLQGSTCWSIIINNPYCQIFQSGVCTTCYNRYFLSPTRICTAINPLCATYDMGNGACLSCVPGTFLSGDKCLTSSDNCTTTNSNGQCSSCPTGYSVYQGLCVSLIGLNPYCIAFNGAFCTDCQPGYYLSAGNVCVVLNTPCATYTVATGACLTCPTGYILFGNICWSITLNNPYCSSFTGITCNACNQGFYLSNGICVLGNALCATYNLNTGACLTCIATYTFQNGLCIYNTPCTTSNATGCLTCPAGYTVYNTLCISLVSLNPYCLTFSGATCTVCQDRYFLGPNGFCIVLNSLCATYNMQTGACNTCPQGYTKVGFACYSLLVQNPYCASFSQSTCNRCFAGYYLNNGICITVSAYCLTYNMNNGNCLTCRAGYTLYSGLCLGRIACATQDNNGYCTSCPSGYQIWQQLCIRIIDLNPYCLTFTGTVCAFCLPNYYLGTNGICIALSSACNTYNMQTGFCLSCPVGYLFYNNQCSNLVYTNPYCQLFTGTICTRCYDRYWLNNGLCVPVNNLCNTYEQLTGLCLTCKSGYIFNNGLCIKNSPCLTTNPVTGACITCPSGFIVFLTLCIDIKTLNPYCLTWNGNVCAACQTNYYVGTNGVCVVVSKLCNTYDQSGNCASCPTGYALFGGNCWNLALPIPPNPACSVYTGTTCTTCYYGWYLANGVCVPSNQYCLTYNMIGGACYTCVVGYYLSGVICLVRDLTCATQDGNGNCLTCNLGFTLWGTKCVGIPSTNPYCQTFSGATCTWCYAGYYLSNGYCVVANPYCNGYNMNSGVCLDCYPGYYLSGALCFNSNPNCLTINVINGWCLTCPSGHALWGNTCVPNSQLNPYCAVFLASGACTVCSQGYYLSSGICVAANPYCATYSQTSGACFTCYAGYYLSGALCLVSNPACATINANNQCLTCYAGYTVVSGNCVSLTSLNPWCQTFSGPSCTQCSAGYYLGGGICIPANPYCLTYNQNTGACLTCNAGYYLSGTNCLAASPICQTINSLGACTSCYSGYIIWGNTCIAQNTLNPYCSSFSGTTCVSCYYGYYLGTGICIVENPYCATYNMVTGACLSCNAGYYLSGTQCWVQNPVCATVDSNNNCLTCFSGYAVQGNTCVSVQTVNPYCQAFTGSICNNCYAGYYLSSGICVAANPYCVTYNMVGGACLTCASGYYLSNAGLCNVLSPYCSSADGNGYCTSCVAGYIVSGQNCVSQTTNNPYCSNWNGPTCNWCYAGYWLGNGYCVAANANCATYNMATGACLSCYSGFYLNGAQCVQMNPYCLTVDAAGSCLTCFSGYAPSAGSCIPYATVNPYCTSWVGSTCSVCASGYYLGVNGICVVGNTNCATWNINTGSCLTCYQGYYQNGGNCLPANPTCATYDSSNGLCLTCASGYTVVSGTCVSQSSLNPYCQAFLASGTCSLCTTGYYIAVGICVPVNPWCATYNPTTGACLTCNAGYYLNGVYCIASSPTCATVDASGLCLTCAPGYTVQSGVCVAYVTINPYCQAFLASGTCTLCYSGYYISSGICVAANPWCGTYSMTTGACLTCNAGYYINSGFCYLANPNCLTYGSSQNCLTCIAGYIVSGSTCVYSPTTNPWCQTWSGTTCTWCYAGYYISNGICVVANPWCATYSMTSGICLSCNAGYYLNSVGNCAVASQNCATYAVNGDCLTCRSGWVFSGTTCIVQPNNGNNGNTNPNNAWCLTWVSSACTACQWGYYVGAGGICTASNPNCATYSQTNGYCLTCWNGWSLSGNSCTVNSGNNNAWCLTYVSSACTACQWGYYLGAGGICTASNPNCATYSQTTGYCLTCWNGWVISGNTCVVQPYNGNNNPWCSTWVSSVCTACTWGYYVGANGICTASSPNCATYSQSTGYCLTCWNGWSLVGNSCVVNSGNNNAWCSTWVSSTCTACQWGYYLGAGGICTASNPNCATYSQTTGYCLTCWNGWVISGNTCVVQPYNGNNNPWCSIWVSSVCTACQWGYYVGANGICTASYPNCATYDQSNGYCLTCWNGWSLSGNTCTVDSGNNHPYCTTWNWATNTCTACTWGYYVGANGICTASNPNCATYSQTTGYCLTCWYGWSLSGNTCVVQPYNGNNGNTNPWCTAWTSSVCTACQWGYYLGVDGICTASYPNCATYSQITGYCLTCWNGWSLSGNSCNVNSGTINPYCSTWVSSVCTACQWGYYIGANGICTASNPNCATYSQITGYCLTCWSGWSLSGNSCVAQSYNGNNNAWCSTWVSSACTACQWGYYLGANGICTTSYPNCATYSQSTGYCLTCWNGWSLSGNSCNVNSGTTNPYCSTWVSSVCTACQWGYYVGANGICTASHYNCYTYSQTTGYCLTCWYGWTLSGNTCVAQPYNGNNFNTNPWCTTWSSSACTACQWGYYIGANGICTASNPNCATYSQSTGYCLTCWSGWSLSGNSCFVNSDNQHPYCITFDAVALACTTCRQGYYYGANGICTASYPNCATYSQSTGYCLTCWSGWSLSGNSCVAQSYNGNNNAWCSAWASSGCTACQWGYYLGANGVCTASYPNCATYSQSTGYCLTCWSGWSLSGNSCNVNSGTTNPYCSTWVNSVCTACQWGYYLGANGRCAVSHYNCYTYSQTTGYCLSCWYGWSLSGNSCVAQPYIGNNGSNNPWCTTWASSFCTACQNGYYVGANGICTASNPNCATYSQSTGYCLTCNSGWYISGNNCVNLAAQNPHCTAWTGSLCTTCSNGYYVGVNGACTAVGSYCATYTMSTGVCLTCTSGYYLSAAGSCLATNPLCATSNSNGYCLTCYSGYAVSGNTCVSLSSIDINCQSWAGLRCTLCGNGYYINANGLCTLADQSCATFNPTNGNCVTCPAGWVISGTTCVVAPVVSIAYCLTYSGSRCTNCSPGYYVTASGSCGVADQRCATYNMNGGACTSCGAGYTLSGSSCVVTQTVSIAYCLTYSGSRCTNCSAGYYVTASGSCAAANPLCTTYNMNGGACTSCPAGYAISGTGCAVSPTPVPNPYCKTKTGSVCTQCYAPYYVGANGICTPASASCKTYNMNTGHCTSCYTGWTLNVATGAC